MEWVRVADCSTRYLMIYRGRPLRKEEIDRETPDSVLLKVLNLTLVLLCLFHAGKGSQVAALAGRFILLTRVQTIFTGFEFADHNQDGCEGST